LLEESKEEERKFWRWREELEKERKNAFFCLTTRQIFSNQPADFLKQLKNLDGTGVLERFSTLSCQSYKC